MKTDFQIRREAQLFPELRDGYEAQGMNAHEADRKATDKAERLAEREADRYRERYAVRHDMNLDEAAAAIAEDDRRRRLPRDGDSD
jgi:hypothetical protein